MNPLQHPDYLAAVRAEQSARDAAFLGVTEQIAGFEVRPLTLWHVLVLRAMASPLLHGTCPTPAELAAFLWLVSVDYTPADKSARRKFLRRCRAFVPSRAPWLRVRVHQRRLQTASVVLLAAREYIETAFADAPDGPGSRTMTSYFSDAASLAAFLWDDYGIPADRALQTSVKQYFQYVRRSRRAADPRCALWNSSDKVLARLVADLNCRSRGDEALTQSEGPAAPDASANTSPS